MNAKKGIPIQHTLIELGHKQPPTPIQADDTTAVGLANDSIKQKYSKALNMRWHWLKNQVKLEHFNVLKYTAVGSAKYGQLIAK